MLADESPKKSLDDGAEDELGLKASLYFQTALAMLEVGGRFTSIRQLNANLAKVTGSAWNGFTGISVPLFKELELRAALGTGLRFPSLSERFFAGTTGRGQVIGNPNLVPERSLDTEIGLRWSGQKLFSSIHLFQNSISEYIERIESQLDVLTFVNLTNGTIRGLEWEGILAPSERWNLYARTHLIRGETEEGDALSDIPVDRITIGLRRSQSKWKMGSEFQFRKGKTFPGSAERVTEGAQLVSAYLACQLTAQLRASLSGENLLDQAFHETADRKSSLTTGRSFSIGLYWTPE
jgi:iron complex outermembrane receptor protein